MQKKISDIFFNEDIYPRNKFSEDIVKRYMQSLSCLPPITINQNNELLDGKHRLEAHIKAGKSLISVEIVTTSDNKHAEELAVIYNSKHGNQLTWEDKKKYAIKRVGDMTINDLASILSASPTSVVNWTKETRSNIKVERDTKIVEKLKKGVQKSTIAKELGISNPTVGRIATKFEDILQNSTSNEILTEKKQHDSSSKKNLTQESIKNNLQELKKNIQKKHSNEEQKKQSNRIARKLKDIQKMAGGLTQSIRLFENENVTEVRDLFFEHQFIVQKAIDKATEHLKQIDGVSNAKIKKVIRRSS